jgi:hypothetical protein
MKKSTAHHASTTADLLPLSATEARRISLNNHVALSALSHGPVEEQALATVRNAICLAIFLHDSDSAMYGRAEAAIEAAVARIRAGEVSHLVDDEHDAIAQCLVQLDALLARLPAHWVFRAWALVERAALSRHCSEIQRKQ